MIPRRLPLESAAPIVVFAVIRLLVTAASVLATVVMSFPYEGALFGVIAAIGLPWALGVLMLARRRPALAWRPELAVGDFAVLVAIAVAVPETYGPARFLALFLAASHAHFQGPQIGAALAAAGSGGLVIAGLVTDPTIGAALQHFYDVVFVVSALAVAVVVGMLRTAESAGRLRAHGVVRRSFDAEDEVRKRIADALHDGPVQELVSLEMMLAAARQAAERGDAARVSELLGEAGEVAGRNIRALRDEVVALGPQAFDQLSFEGAVEQSAPVWRRRYGIPVVLEFDRVEMSSAVGGALYRIAQEAVANAGRHAGANRIVVTLARRDDGVEMRVADDGRGFGDTDPLGQNEPGHLGLATMRERAEAVGGRLSIETGADGTVVSVSAPSGS